MKTHRARPPSRRDAAVLLVAAAALIALPAVPFADNSDIDLLKVALLAALTVPPVLLTAFVQRRRGPGQLRVAESERRL